jgi:hypothetical protein
MKLTSKSRGKITCYDPELEKMAVKWTPKKRRAMAVKFNNWAIELQCTATLLDAGPLLLPVTKN